MTDLSPVEKGWVNVYNDRRDRYNNADTEAERRHFEAEMEHIRNTMSHINFDDPGSKPPNTSPSDTKGPDPFKPPHRPVPGDQNPDTSPGDKDGPDGTIPFGPTPRDIPALSPFAGNDVPPDRPEPVPFKPPYRVPDGDSDQDSDKGPFIMAPDGTTKNKPPRDPDPTYIAPDGTTFKG